MARGGALEGIESEAVDAATLRSVLIYVEATQEAFASLFRVLKPGGMLSIYEPINRFGYPEPENVFRGMDVTRVIKIARKVKDFYLQVQPLTDPLFGFDERDLVQMAEKAGFKEIHMELEVRIGSQRHLEQQEWNPFLKVPGNPKVPNLEEAMEQVLTDEEVATFTSHLRPLVESGTVKRRFAQAFLWGRKG